MCAYSKLVTFFLCRLWLSKKVFLVIGEKKKKKKKKKKKNYGETISMKPHFHIIISVPHVEQFSAPILMQCVIKYLKKQE